MHTLITAVMVGVLVRGCASAPLQGEENVHEKRSVTDSMVSKAALTQQPWSVQGYTGPTAVPVVLGDGTIAETPEVAAARMAHLAALEISRVTNHGMDDGHYDPHKYGDHLYSIVSHSGHLSNRINAYNGMAPDHTSGLVVAGSQHSAENAQDNAYSQAKASEEAGLSLWTSKNASGGGYSYETQADQNKPYTGPLAMPQVLASGYLQDTLEVAAAKKIHLSALAAAQAAEALWRANHHHTQHKLWN